MGPDNYWFGARPQVLFDRRGAGIDQLIEEVRAAVVNYPNARIPYTRVTEFRHLTGQRLDSSTLSYEFPADDGDPYYPIPRAENRALYKRYQALAAQDPGVTFVGRLARYQYLNMDQVVGQALATFEKLRPRLVERDAALRPRPR